MSVTDALIHETKVPEKFKTVDDDSIIRQMEDAYYGRDPNNPNGQTLEKKYALLYDKDNHCLGAFAGVNRDGEINILRSKPANELFVDARLFDTNGGMKKNLT